MQNKRIYQHLLTGMLFLFAYGFLFYKLADNRSLSSLTESVLFLEAKAIVLLLAAMALVPVNWLIEALKWKSISSSIKPLSLKEALNQVIMSLFIGQFSPGRIGEIPARMFFLDRKRIHKSGSAALLSSFSQLSATVFFGISGLLYHRGLMQQLLNKEIGFKYNPFLLLAVLLLFIVLFLSKKGLRLKLKETIKELKLFKFSALRVALTYSFLRYLVFSTQFLFALKAFGISVGIPDMFFIVSMIYLFNAFMPGFIVIEPALRASIAIVLFELISIEPISVVLASTIIWVLNIIAPSFLGLLFIHRRMEKHAFKELTFRQLKTQEKHVY